MSRNASLGEFTGAEEGPSEPSAPSLVDRLLEPISPTLGLRLIPGDGDPFYLHNRGTEQYLFRDEHGRWLVLQPSADQSNEFVRWVYLPDSKPQTVARTAIRQRTVIGYDYVQRVDAPDPARSTVTAKFVANRFPESTIECGSCGASFEIPNEHARSTAGTSTRGYRSRRRSVDGANLVRILNQQSPGGPFAGVG